MILIALAAYHLNGFGLNVKLSIVDVSTFFVDFTFIDSHKWVNTSVSSQSNLHPLKFNDFRDLFSFKFILSWIKDVATNNFYYFFYTFQYNQYLILLMCY